MSFGRLVGLAFMGLVAAIATPVVAQTAPESVGIRIVDAPTSRAGDPRALQYIVDHVAPGTTISRRVEISNDTSGPQAVQLYAAAASIDGSSFRFGDGRASNDLTSWTTVDPPTVTPPAGAKDLATVTIVVPPEASAGERYGVVWAELPAAVPAGGGVSSVNRVGVRIYLSVGEGGEPPTDFSITAFEARRDQEGKPVVAATVRNTGGRAIDLSGELRLTGGPGGLSTGPFPAELGTTLGIGQAQPVLVTLDPAIPLGPWDARIVLRSGSTERDATAKITFPASTGSSGSVDVRSPSSGGAPSAAILGGVAALVVLGSLVLLRLRRRRSRHVPEVQI